MRFNDPTRDLESDLIPATEVNINCAELSLQESDSDAYGACLTRMLFGGPDSRVRRAFERARNTVQGGGGGLRVRLAIQRSAKDLHALRWETLRDPSDGTRLLMHDQLWFSRFLSSQDFRFRPAPERSRLQALIVIADPTDQVTRWGLASIDRQVEKRRANLAFESAQTQNGFRVNRTTLAEPATVVNIVRKLRELKPDILYIVCHGMLTREGDPRLLLEDDEQRGRLADGEDLVQRLKGMTERPRVIIMASCESAGDAAGGMLAAIGPRLVFSGVPAVIAMQGKISVESLGVFMPAFLVELAATGQIDQAMAVARSAIADRPDWWMPTLFMRLKIGRIWQSSAPVTQDFQKWRALALDIQYGECVPVLGPGLIEGLLGSTRDVARQWAERYEFPLAPRDRDDLAQVAQYLAYHQSKRFAIEELRRELVALIRDSYQDELQHIAETTSVDWRTGDVNVGQLDKLISALGKEMRQKDPRDPHKLLATLPFKIFINANRDNLLRDALIEQGKTPQVCLCTWIVSNGVPHVFGDPLPQIFTPSDMQPLIFQVFGNLEYPASLVLTEDDYFEFLIAVTRNEKDREVSVPPVVWQELTLSGLLLLGFQPDDWDFRVLLRGILKQNGAALARDRTRVAVQLSPIEGRILHPDRAIRYIQKYFNWHFQPQGEIETFWASPREFIEKLVQHYPDDGNGGGA
ncbi:CHAT domain-containing protein [Caballeronia sp. LZ024]|nr:CHAT domain-containing protein [Caballeronia sp. LZ024]